MTNPQDMESRLSRVEVDLADLKQIVAETSRNVSELRSSIATLADIVASHEVLHEESRQRFEQFVERSDRDRALMLQLIQAIAQGRNGG
nr:MAG: hypothetical protein EDM05_17660 [Leptolyngbya sp. IPPAS B-1204]